MRCARGGFASVEFAEFDYARPYAAACRARRFRRRRARCRPSPIARKNLAQQRLVLDAVLQRHHRAALGEASDEQLRAEAIVSWDLTQNRIKS